MPDAGHPSAVDCPGAAATGQRRGRRATGYSIGGPVAGVLKEESAVRDYWLEPASRRVEPVSLSMTDLDGKVIEQVRYTPVAGLQLQATRDRRTCVLIDFGKEVGGYPRLVFGTGDCRLAGVQAVESIAHIKNPVFAGSASLADSAMHTANFRPREGRTVELPHFGGFRYLWVYPWQPGRVTLRDVYLDYTPFLSDDPDECGYFLCSDDTLNRCWFAGFHTIEMCTVDPTLGSHRSDKVIGEGDWVLVDGAKRDRLIWTGDLAPMAAAVFVGDFNTGAVRDSLASLAAHQHGNGYIPACSVTPGLGRTASGFFGDYVAWWVVILYQYYLHTGDRQTIEEMMPVAKKALAYLHSQTRRGLFRQTPLNMMEWCFTVMRFGRPTYTNVMYYWALNCAAFLAHELEDDEFSIGCVSRAYRLGEVIERELWDSARCAFIDTTWDRRRVPQDGNSLAIVSGLVNEPFVANGILEYMQESMWEDWGSTNVDIPYYRVTPGWPAHNKRVMPFMNNYEALARFTSGDAEGAMELIRRCWGNMVDREPGSSFWEWVGRDGRVDGHFCSLCHGWSAGVVPLLSKFVLGIRPASAGYRHFRFDPRPSGLDWVEGRVRVPGGFIEARVERKGEGLKTSVSAPRGYSRAD